MQEGTCNGRLLVGQQIGNSISISVIDCRDSFVSAITSKKEFTISNASSLLILKAFECRDGSIQVYAGYKNTDNNGSCVEIFSNIDSIPSVSYKFSWDILDIDPLGSFSCHVLHPHMLNTYIGTQPIKDKAEDEFSDVRLMFIYFFRMAKLSRNGFPPGYFPMNRSCEMILFKFV